MANEMIEVALAGVLEEMGRNRKAQEEQKVILSTMVYKMEIINKRLNDEPSVPQAIDTTPIEVSIIKGITRLQRTIETQPKTVKKEYRILLFPEHGAREYYRLVFGKLMFWLFVVLLSTYLFALGKQAVQSSYTIHSQEKELKEYKEYVHNLEEKENKKKKIGYDKLR